MLSLFVSPWFSLVYMYAIETKYILIKMVLTKCSMELESDKVLVSHDINISRECLVSNISGHSDSNPTQLPL